MNSNTQVAKFSNGRVRVMADLLASSYISAKKLLLEWQTQGLAALIPANEEQIDDGADRNGRPIITDSNVLAIILRWSVA